MDKEDLKNIKSGKGYLEKIFAIAEENRKLTLALLALVILVVYLGLALVKIKHSLILTMNIPQKAYYSGEAQIAEDRANPLFYKLWGAYIVRDGLGNYDHRNIKEKYRYVIDNLSPEKVGRYAPGMRDKIKKTTSQLITHTYSPGKIMTKGDKYNFTYISYGKGHKKIGDIEEYDENCEYQVDLSVLDFRMKIDRIYEKCTRIKG
jgi:hypothetical protein